MKKSVLILTIILSVTTSAVIAGPRRAAPTHIWDTLAKAAANVRVGHADGALKILRPLIQHPTGIEGTAPVIRILHARALLAKSQPDRALETLGPLLKNPPLYLSEVVRLVWLRSAAALNDHEQVLRSTELLLTSKDLPDLLRDETLFQRARSLCMTPGRVAEGISILNDLRGQGSKGAIAFKPAVLELLATYLPKRRQGTVLRHLIIHYGGTFQGRRALKRFDLNQLNPKQQLKRARKLYEDRAYDLASDAYASIAKGPGRKLRQEAQLRMATMRMRLRKEYPVAYKELEAAEKGPNTKFAAEAYYRRGLMEGNLGNFRRGSRHMRRYRKKWPRGDHRVRATYQIGRLLHQNGDFDSASKELEKFVKAPYGKAVKWRWFYGWSHFRRGDYAQARTIWTDLLKSPKLLVSDKARYWMAVSYLKENKKSRAQKSLKRLLQTAPYSYYGFLGSTLQAQLSGGSPIPARDPNRFPLVLPQRPDLTVWARTAKNDNLRRSLIKVQRVAAAGFPSIARHVVKQNKVEEKLIRNMGSRHRDTIVSGLDFWLERWGYRWKQRAKKARFRQIAWVQKMTRFADDTLRVVFPPAYLDLATAAGELHDISPWWLISHMLQESRYKEFAASHAGARGPMQILPRTGRRISQQLGFPMGEFYTSQLFEPGIALRQAAWYLDALRTEFNGNITLAIAAYNGGPLRFAEYLTMPSNRKLPMDMFIEEIGAHESRNYVRKVTDHIVRFTTLYASDSDRDALLSKLLMPERLPSPKGKLRF
ncbi:MAG: hypothetical protein CMH54_11775 [Myxococcales bacterium]|nr:hypothetical protein [Myxococcales bacterium]|tara:strand:- start:106 stop:2400 length:2295 start_codon:yes stop_codon:yes gene_type:complete